MAPPRTGGRTGDAGASATKLIASNKKARHDYSIEDTIECGIVLSGSEVKALREGQVRLADAFARVIRGQVWLDGVHIPQYQFAHGIGAHDPDRARKLLMHRSQIDKLDARINQERVSLVPLAFYFKDGRVKVEIGIGKGRKKSDKRNALAERDVQREMQRALGRQNKGTDRLL
ncbi:MAG: SsrA-binding protein SmpB [Ilumatobacteraceae bacterium]|jgi:SsrA-binding protein